MRWNTRPREVTDADFYAVPILPKRCRRCGCGIWLEAAFRNFQSLGLVGEHTIRNWWCRPCGAAMGLLEKWRAQLGAGR